MIAVGKAPPQLFAATTQLRRRLRAGRYQFRAAPAPSNRQLLVDVSVIVREDAHTGIQRSVRALMGQLVQQPAALHGISVRPVFAARDHGYCYAHVGADGTLRPTAPGEPAGLRRRVEVRRGDVFLGLDLAANIMPHCELELAKWRRAGVSLNIMVYDLLPMTNPQWFAPRTVQNFRRWMGVLARQADRCICISDVVAGDLARRLSLAPRRRSVDIGTIPLGADLRSSQLTTGFPADISELRQWLNAGPVLLSVGTVEPRKGHDVLLDALDWHWQNDPHSKVKLLVVGRPGWKTESLQQRLRTHGEQGHRLRWLESASDELLAELYRSTAGLVSASRGEGFGLPLVEALVHGAPVLARDLPVFREIGGRWLDYFEDDTPAALSGRVMAWLVEARRPTAVAVAALPRWSDSAAALLKLLGFSASPVRA
ncbi:glycosyltransferase involved in cell wall biosynthesis [Polymorphobacter multimanifer]|uniref:Glycosyltransferase involved in cell wall biosynthesis n=1 Tax=Polymorphobacter multimanifer TaxID=1070431 RepID=A0A841LDB8_9SPHN|nr:glycosyltransferase involved in cell wall biosynthesis [Polymorphobacter multimanifer]